MKFNKYFMLGLAGLAFAACSNDEDVTNGNEEGKVRVTLSLGRTETRALGPTAKGVYNTVTDLKIIFYNSAGAYVAHPVSGTINGVDYNNETAVNKAVEALNAGHSATIDLKEIPSSATQMLVVANSKNKTNGVSTQSLDAAKKTTIYLKQQVIEEYKTFEGEESRMTGLGQIVTKNGVSSVDVSLKPVPSRIELKDVTAQKLPAGVEWGGVDIQSFEVRGFYVNSFYETGFLDATDDPNRARIDNESDPENYTKNAYTTAEWGFMCDEPTEGQMTSQAGTEGSNVIWENIVTDRNNKYFGYMVIKGIPVDVVIKLNVTFTDGSNADKYLTIRNYKYAPDQDGYTAGDVVSTFERGTVYRVNNVPFDVRDLTDVPYEQTTSLTANVEVLPWAGVDVTPGFS